MARVFTEWRIVTQEDGTIRHMASRIQRRDLARLLILSEERYHKRTCVHICPHLFGSMHCLICHMVSFDEMPGRLSWGYLIEAIIRVSGQETFSFNMVFFLIMIRLRI